jgi:hypothetical protein
MVDFRLERFPEDGCGKRMGSRRLRDPALGPVPILFSFPAFCRSSLKALFV